MVLQMIAQEKNLLEEIAEGLLTNRLIVNAMISEAIIYKTISDNDQIITSSQYTLKGISKSLLFKNINTWLVQKYGAQTPLLYSEPIIMIDPDQTEQILSRLQAI